jgi:type IV pilus assembly protein PilA
LNKKGVTLLELIMVIAILSIVAAFAVPNYFDYLKRANIAENAAKMAAELRTCVITQAPATFPVY